MYTYVSKDFITWINNSHPYCVNRKRQVYEWQRYILMRAHFTCTPSHAYYKYLRTYIQMLLYNTFMRNINVFIYLQERPVSFDEPKEEEDKFHKACSLLRVFYLNFNPDKLKDINSILVQYRSKYTELFLSLAEKYNVEDLSIFEELGAFN